MRYCEDGLGALSPLTSLHLLRTNGTAKILVQETSTTTAPRNTFELINNGPIGFNMTNSNIAQTWRFAAQIPGFRVSLDGSGGPEMEVGNGGTLQVGPGGAANLFLDTAGNLTIQGLLTEASDVNAKEDFVDLEGTQVLAKLSALPVTAWSFKGDPVRHIGPSAQDSHAAFGLGADDKHLAPKDVASVALVGVKELNKTLEKEIKTRDAEIAELRQRLAALEEMLTRVVAQQPMQAAQR